MKAKCGVQYDRVEEPDTISQIDYSNNSSPNKKNKSLSLKLYGIVSRRTIAWQFYLTTSHMLA